MKNHLVLLAIILSISACYYDNEENLYPALDTVCDTTLITYSFRIVPILQTNCYPCHGTSQFATDGGNVNLQEYAFLKRMVDGGNFYGAILHDPHYSPMPKGGSKLDTCSITKIKIWIDKGALNN